MTAPKMRVGIAGYGVVGRRRRVHIDSHPAFATVAVSDQAFERDGQLEDGTASYTDFTSLFDCDLDVLFVCLPNYLAAEATTRGLESGFHVFCEKPPARTVAEVEAVRAVEDRSGQKLRYGFNHRHHASVKEALAIVASGTLGTIINLSGLYGKSHIIPFDKGWRAERRLAGGGILLDQGIHMVDLMMLFCGDFTEVHSVVTNRYWNHDVEDNAYALMRNAAGQVGMLHSSATKWSHAFRLEITLTEGYLSLDGILSGSRSYGEERLVIGRRSLTDTGTPREEVVKYLIDTSWADEIDDFARCIVENRPVTDGSSLQALKTMSLVYRIYGADPAWQKYLTSGMAG